MTVGQTGNFIDFIQSSGRGASEVHNGHSAQSVVGFQSGDLIYLDAAMSAKGGNGKGGQPPPPDGGTDSTPPPDSVTDTYTTGFDDGIDDISQYNIQIDFVGEWSVELKSVFIASADYLALLVSEGISSATDASGNLLSDLTITADLADIDGVGGILGQAGPTAIWTASELTALGEMTFDQADAQEYFELKLFDDIVLHEMMHVMGVGTLWSYNNLVSTIVVDDNDTKKPTDDIVDSVYTGAAANSSFKLVTGSDAFLFVETDGGAGTAGGHWDEETYRDELMTGYIGHFQDGTYDNTNYLSEWSVASLEDLGYVLFADAVGIADNIVLA
jgi:hypothetical protein